MKLVGSKPGLTCVKFRYLETIIRLLLAEHPKQSSYKCFHLNVIQHFYSKEANVSGLIARLNGFLNGHFAEL